jgi:hypothetical protein
MKYLIFIATNICKKKMKFLIIFIFAVLLRTIIGLNIENYCHPLELKCPNNCTSKSNEKKCLNLNYRCEPNLCTVNKIACNQYRNKIAIYGNNIAAKEYLYRVDFKSRIKKCPTIESKIRAIDFCSNPVNCKNQTSFANILSKLNEYLDCFCFGKYSHQCGLNLCSSKKHTCNNLKQFKPIDLRFIKECERKNLNFRPKMRF